MSSKPRAIDLSEWNPVGGLGDADRFVNKSDARCMLKLFRRSDVSGKPQKELAINQALVSLGIPTPRALEVVHAEGRTGLIYERLAGDMTLARAIASEPDRLEELSGRFGTALKELHEIPTDAEPLRDTRRNHAHFLPVVEQSGLLSPAQFERISAIMDDSDRNVCVHGNATLRNVVLSAGKTYLVDFDAVSCGNPLNDLGNWYAITHGAMRNEMSEYLFHLDNATLLETWRPFLRSYLETDDEADLAQVEADLKPFAAIVPLRNAMCGHADPERADALVKEFLGC